MCLSDELYASEGEIHKEGCGTRKCNNMVCYQGIRCKVFALLRDERGK